MTTKAYAPVRPPRGSKVSKDTSGRLITIIAELSVSKSNDDRKHKMNEIKNDMSASDDRLVRLLTANKKQLSQIMESFSKISSKISSSRTGCRDAKTKLKACKKLLECKREEVRRLWTESIEHECILNTFKEISDLNSVNDKIEHCLRGHEFLKATELLVAGVSLLDGKLSDADGLKNLKTDLNTQRKKLHQVCFDKIVEEIYKSDSTLPKTSALKLPVEGAYYDFSTAKASYDHIGNLLRCIALLNTLPETVELLKESCSNQLMLIIQNSSAMMYERIENVPYHEQFGDSTEETPYLQHLLQVILHRFREVSINHFAFLHNLERIAMTKNLTDCFHYEMADLYSQLQASVALFVTDYLDLHNSSSIERVAHATPFAPLPMNISTFFLRKGNITRTKRKENSLFTFDNSSHAINKKTYLQDPRRREDSLYMKEKGEMESVESEVSKEKILLIAEPNIKNIKLMYKLLKEFIADIETALRLEAGTHCPLHTFLTDCVKSFLDEVNIDANRLYNDLESWKPATDIDELKLAEVKAPQILNTTLTVKSILIEMGQLIDNLPDYSSHFLQIIVNILEHYKDLCNSAYKGLVYADSKEQIFSVSYAMDPDISRLLRSLPNYIKVDSLEEETEDFEESPQEVHFRNKAESDLLIRNLCNRGSISPNEIISDHEKLRNLALMHESMEYFSQEIISFADKLPDFHASVSSLYLPDKFSGDESEANFEVGGTKTCLKRVAKEFEHLASTSLLVLHLEVRAHCFYHLLKLSKTYTKRKEDEEPEPEVLKLNADLSKIDEALSRVLQPKKMRYIFEGLGELLSTILINSVSNIKKINENGVKKMGRNIFAIQQNLAGITMTREVALDRARQYFDLLNHTFEEILNQIVEEGPQFQEQEYSSLIQLLFNSRDIGCEHPLNHYLEKLRQILDEVAVSV